MKTKWYGRNVELSVYLNSSNWFKSFLLLLLILLYWITENINLYITQLITHHSWFPCDWSRWWWLFSVIIQNKFLTNELIGKIMIFRKTLKVTKTWKVVCLYGLKVLIMSLAKWRTLLFISKWCSTHFLYF